MKGGKREGAGRPCKDPAEKRVMISVWVDPETRARIQKLRKRDNLKIGYELDWLVADLYRESNKRQKRIEKACAFAEEFVKNHPERFPDL